MVSFEAEERVLAALASGAKPGVARAAGPMSVASLQRRMRSPEFRVRLELKRQVVSTEIDANLRSLARRSMQVLGELLERADRPDLQARVAIALLPVWLKTRDFELDERMAALEEGQAAWKDQVHFWQERLAAVTPTPMTLESPDTVPVPEAG